MAVRVTEAAVPAVCVWDLQSFHHGRTRKQADGIQVELIFAKLVDQIAQTLPCQHLYEDIRHEVGYGCVGVGGLNVGKRMWKLLGWRPRHSVKFSFGEEVYFEVLT